MNEKTLFSDNIRSRAQECDWSEGYAERWEIVRPDFHDMEAAQLFEWADSFGVTLDDDPREHGRPWLVECLESIGVACYTEETDEELAQAFGDSMIAGDLPGNCSGWADEIAERYEEDAAPMMNYRYPVYLRGIDDSEAASALENLPLTLIYDYAEDAHYMALTGGGMDLARMPFTT